MNINLQQIERVLTSYHFVNTSFKRLKSQSINDTQTNQNFEQSTNFNHYAFLKVSFGDITLPIQLNDFESCYSTYIINQFWTIIIQQNKMTSQRIMNGMDFLREQYIEELSLAMAKMFLKNNELWASFNLNLEEVRQLFVDMLHDHLESEARTWSYMGQKKRVNFVYFIDGKIASSLHHYEMQDYKLIRDAKKASKVGLFDNLQKYGKQLFKDVDLSLYQKGKHVYANFGFTNDEVAPPKFTYEMMLLYCKYLKQAGFISMICRTSNPRTDLLYKSLGGKVLKQLTFNENGVSGPLGLVTLEFNNPVFNKILEKRAKLQKANSEPRPSL